MYNKLSYCLVKCEHKKIKYSLMKVVLEFENGDLARQRIRMKPRRSIPLNIGLGKVQFAKL